MVHSRRVFFFRVGPISWKRVGVAVVFQFEGSMGKAVLLQKFFGIC
jgi:hypothetical protein